MAFEGLLVDEGADEGLGIAGVAYGDGLVDAAEAWEEAGRRCWSVTRRRRRVVQRWPAVPMAAKATARRVRSRLAVGQTIPALLPPSSRRGRAKRAARRGPTARPMRVEPVAETRGTRGESTRASPTVCVADEEGGEAFGELGGVVARRSLAAARVEEGLGGEGGEGCLLGGLPDDGVAADEGEGGVPAPDGDGEVEGGDDAGDAEGVPLLHHAVVRALGLQTVTPPMVRERPAA